MCLIAWRWNPQSATPLLWAGNRDEFAHRATAAQSVWAHDDVSVLSGLDLAAEPHHGVRGTWAGCADTGKFAWLTNIRSHNDKNPTAPSRGFLVSDYLLGSASPAQFIEQLKPKAQRFNGFNLVIGYVDNAAPADSQCWHYNSRKNAANQLNPGIYGLSNADLDTPWPKTLALVHSLNIVCATLQPHLAPQDSHCNALFDALNNRAIYPADTLPSTGLSIEREQQLSAAFIATQFQSPADDSALIAYGTRSSVVAWFHARQFSQLERSFAANGDLVQQSRYSLSSS